MDISQETFTEQYKSCRLCPRQCEVDRLSGEAGFCGSTAELRIAAILPHFGEEPCITGQNGSGTVFFTGCSCGCFFCQNHQISHGQVGKIYSIDGFVNALLELIGKGVHNLNFVTPDHYWPHIKKACEILREKDIYIPFLWNSSGYCSSELVAEQTKTIDVFLPDFKYADPELAETCMGDRNYPEIALKAIEVMVDRTGFLRPWDQSGEITATRGTLVRHLVLPGQLENSIKAIDMLYDHFGPLLPLSIMSQFQPMPECQSKGLFTRKLEAREYDTIVEHALDLGFQRLFTQEDCGDDNFAPDFTLDNPFGTGNRKQR